MKTQVISKRPHFRPAFTLIEILISITIIVVLAAISFIALKKVKESASAAVDANDMRGIGGAVIMYATDHNDFLPTTSGGISPTYRPKARDLKMELHEYFGYENPQEGDFFKEFASADWQSATVNTDSYGPSLLVLSVYSGNGKPTSNMKPSPSFYPFGYPYNNGQDPMQLNGAISKMGDPANRLMLVEIDKQLPQLGNPGWIDSVPEKMAHGSYRLGLYWDGHVGRLDINLDPL